MAFICHMCNKWYDTKEEADKCYEIHYQKLMVKMMQDVKINVEELRAGPDGTTTPL